MNLIDKSERAAFNLELFKKRGFIRAKYHSWEESRNGLIVFAAPDFLKVIFLTGIVAATSYYVMKISEVEAGLWEFIFSTDLETFYQISGGEEKVLTVPLSTALTDAATLAGGQSVIASGLTLFCGRLITYGKGLSNGNSDSAEINP